MSNINFTIDHNKIIHISTSELNEPCKAIYQLNELIPPEEIKRLFPVSWEYIMEGEKYGCFFTMGSPQMMEEGWKVDVKYESHYMHVTLQIPNQEVLERRTQMWADAMKFRRQNM